MVGAVRALWLGTPAGNDIWGSVAWCQHLGLRTATPGGLVVPPMGPWFSGPS